MTTDNVIFGYDGAVLKVLLIRRGIEPFKDSWALPGGFIRMDESADEGAMRELHEETGLQVRYLRQFHTFSRPDRDPRERVITIAYCALVELSDVEGGDDAAEARWFDFHELPDLAFDHAQILAMGFEFIRRQIHFEPVGFDLLPEKFTMRDLQNLYEIILSTKLDRRNFFNKIRKLGIVSRTDETIRQSVKRDAQLYTFNRERYEELTRSKEQSFDL